MEEYKVSWWKRLSSTQRWLLAISIIAGAGIATWGIYHHVATTQQSTISLYRPEDRPEILSMLRDDWYWLVAEGVVDFSPEYMLDHYAATFHYPDNSLSIMVYRDERGKAIGFITYHKLEALKGRIQFLAVARHARKKGIAQKLITHAIDALKKQGFCFIEIAVRSHNIPAKTLYVKNGFAEIWRTEDGFLGLSKRLC